MTELETKDWVYDQLGDEESKFIFNKRRQFNDSDDYKHIGEIIDKYVKEYSDYKWYPDKEYELIREIKTRNKKVIIFGSGYYGEKVLNLCKKNNVAVDFFCDSDRENQGKKIDHKIPVILPEKLLEINIIENYIIIVSPKFAYNQIVNTLFDMGIPNSHIYRFVDYTGRTLTKQYFDDEILQIENNEVFIDGGCFDFRTSQLFLKKVEEIGIKYKKIYAFEPDKINFEKSKTRIEKLNLKNIDLVKAGLWSKKDNLKFSSQGNGASHILSLNDKEINRVDVVALDEYIKEKVTFIKMDIEGAELEALKGARQILLRDKPKLAICIYHKKEDLWEIPYYVKTLVPEYKLYIRHYSNDATETVLYAI